MRQDATRPESRTTAGIPEAVGAGANFDERPESGELRTWLLRGALAVVLGFGALAILIATLTDDSQSADLAGEKAGPGDFRIASAIPPPRSDLSRAAPRAGCRLVHPPNEGDRHVGSRVRYRANPPTSGDHNPRPADDGAYMRAPAAETTVHSLEHGRVFIQFRPDAPESVKGGLVALFEEDDHHMLLAPNNTGMRTQVAATAWNHALLCPRMNDDVYDAIRAFRDRYRDRGPELVE